MFRRIRHPGPAGFFHRRNRFTPRKETQHKPDDPYQYQHFHDLPPSCRRNKKPGQAYARPGCSHECASAHSCVPDRGMTFLRWIFIFIF